MGAGRDDPSALDQHHAIGQRNRRQPVRDQDRRALLEGVLDCVVDRGLDLDVDGTGRVVEHQDRWVLEQRAGDRDALPLPTRQRVAPFADDGVVAVVELGDEVVGLGCAGGGNDLVECGVGSAVGDVVAHRGREEERLVEDQADVVPEAGQRVAVDRHAVDQDLAVVDVVEAGQQAGDRRLAAAGAADDRDRLTRFDREIEIAQYRFAAFLGSATIGRRCVRVGEGDAPELDATLGVGQLDRVGWVVDRDRLVEHGVHACRRCAGSLGLQQQEAEHAERRLQHQDVGVEGEEGPDRDPAVDGEQTAVEQYEGHADPGQGLDEGVPVGALADRLDVGPSHVIGRPGQLVDLALLGRKRLDHPGAVDVLVDDRRQLGHAGLAHPGEGEDVVPHLLAEEENSRQRRKGHQREGYVDRQHEGEREDEGKDAHRHDRAEREQHLDRTDVAVRPRDDFPRLGAVVVAERQPGQMPIEQRPQVGLDTPGDLVQ